MGKVKNWLNRTAFAVSQKMHVAAANTWRDSYNPLRSLTITRGVHLLEEGERGAYANLQWLYRYIEMGDATYGALIERRVAAIKELDWDIRIPADLAEDKKALAEAQKEHLQEVYTRIRNIKDAVEHLTMASFRGYSHLELVRDEQGYIIELGVVPQWHWVRDGLNGRWQYNANSAFGTHKGEDVRMLNLEQDDSELDNPELLAEFVVREVDRPIGRVAVICFIRKGLSQKDWDGFIETYGIPSIFVIAPPELGTNQQEEFQDTAEKIASDSRGTLPGGSDVKTVDNGARGVNPFADHIKYQDEQLVLRGTGGKLSMLTDATGMGSGASDTHSDTFDQIAKAEAQDISEFLQCAIDEVELENAFPGQEQLAYFQLAANEETDTSAIVADVATLATAGYKVTPEYLLEKTGYEVNLEVASPQESASPQLPVASFENRNRRIENRQSNQTEGNETFLEDSKKLLDEARLSDLQPIRTAFETALQTEDADDFVKQLTAINDALPETATPAQEEALQDILFTAVINGFGEVEPEEEPDLVKNNCGNGADGFKSGNKCGKSTKGTSREGRSKRQSKSSDSQGRKDSRSQQEIVRDKTEVSQLLEKVGKGENTSVTLSEPLEATVKQLSDHIDTEDKKFSVSIGANEVRHIRSKHGDASESARGQRAVRDEDLIKRLPALISDPDQIKKSSETGSKGQTRLEYNRKIKGETHKSIIQVNRENSSDPRLSVVTYFIKK